MANLNSQVAHLWAAQRRDSARTSNGNFSFRGRSLFSYTTEIARFIEGRVIQTTQKYSVTTTGKHASEIHGAVRGTEHYYVDRHMRDLPDSWELVAPIVFADMLRSIKTQIESILRSKKTEYRVQWLRQYIEKTNAFAAQYPDAVESAQLDDTTISLDDLRRFSTKEAEERSSNGDQIVLMVLRERFGADVAAKISAERAANKARNEANKRAEEIRARERAEREARRAEKIAAWSNDLSISTSEIGYGAPMMLRINGRRIETSHGAIISMSDAIDLWKHLQSGGDPTDRYVGDFRIRGYDNESLTIGCHVIPFAEIRRIAALLKLDSTSAESIAHG